MFKETLVYKVTLILFKFYAILFMLYYDAFFLVIFIYSINLVHYVDVIGYEKFHYIYSFNFLQMKYIAHILEQSFELLL